MSTITSEVISWGNSCADGDDFVATAKAYGPIAAEVHESWPRDHAIARAPAGPTAFYTASGTLRVFRNASSVSPRMLAYMPRFVIFTTRANFSSTKKHTPY
jgi:hypothetical protein